MTAAAGPAGGRVLQFERFEEIKPDLDRPCLVDGWLHPGALSVLFGDSGAGKTYLALDLALRVARGSEWFGCRVMQGTTAYVAAEGGGGIRARIEAFRQHYDLDGQTVPFRLLVDSVDLWNPQADTRPLIAAVREFGEVSLLVIDTLARALAGGDENSSKDMGALIRNVDAVRTATGAHVMLIHHTGKDQARGARGHSSLRAAVDTEIEVQQNGSGRGTIKATKQRDLETAPQVAFRLAPVEIGVNAQGKAVTSCVVEPEAVPLLAFGRSTIKPKNDAFRMLAALSDLAGKEGEARDGTEPPGVLMVRSERWREVCMRDIFTNRTADASRQAFYRGRKSLRRSGHVLEDQDWCGIAP